MFDVEKTSDLIQKSKDGDKDALDALIVENTPLVKSVVRRYSGKNVEYDDQKRTIESRPSTKYQKRLTSIRKKSFSRWTAQDIRCR